MIQFEGRQNSIQFWSQDEALAELKVQLQYAVSDGMPVAPVHERPAENLQQPPKKPSWFGRKSSKAAGPVQEARGPACPIEVDVQLDEIYFRSETEYGLYETLRVKVVAATIVVR